MQSPSILSTLDEYEFIIAPLIFTFLAFFTRMYKIGLSDIVTWDEAQYVENSTPRSGKLQSVKLMVRLFIQLWQIWFPLLETGILFRCTSSSRENVGGPFRSIGGLQWLIRIQIG